MIGRSRTIATATAALAMVLAATGCTRPLGSDPGSSAVDLSATTVVSGLPPLTLPTGFPTDADSASASDITSATASVSAGSGASVSGQTAAATDSGSGAAGTPASESDAVASSGVPPTGSGPLDATSVTWFTTVCTALGSPTAVPIASLDPSAAATAVNAQLQQFEVASLTRTVAALQGLQSELPDLAPPDLPNSAAATAALTTAVRTGLPAAQAALVAVRALDPDSAAFTADLATALGPMQAALAGVQAVPFPADVATAADALPACVASGFRFTPAGSGPSATGAPVTTG